MSEAAGASEAVEAPRFPRGDVEFGRAINYFDATFAIATTLLVTNLDPGAEGWASWSGLADTTQGPMLAFGLSFVVVSTFWWANHRFIASLGRLSPRFVVASLLMLAFVVLLPFTTEGIGVYSGANGSSGSVPTVCYALNVAGASLSALLLFYLALRDDLYLEPPSRDAILVRTVGLLDTPIVFLLSIPIALFWSTGAAHLSWLTLIVTGVISGRWAARRLDRPIGAGGPR